MNDLFLQELNAITNYANNSNTDLTEQTVRDMLTNLLNMRQVQLYGNRCCPFGDDEKSVKEFRF